WQLERSLRGSRRLLSAWEPAETPAPEPSPGPETNEEAPPAASTPSPQDLKEPELLTQALEKAVRVRKGISKAGEGDKGKVPSLKSASMAASPATRASAPSAPHAGLTAMHQRQKPPGASTKPGGGSGLYGEGAEATKPEPGRRDQQIVPLAAPQAPEAFPLKDKGSAQTSDSVDAATTAKIQFLQKMQTTSSWPGSRLSAAEAEAELRHLQEACLLLRLRMGKSSRQSPRTGHRSSAACSPRRGCRPSRGSVSAG
ncbi:hypothetical protein EI555_008649, partial [Monodon monoceros]